LQPQNYKEELIADSSWLKVERKKIKVERMEKRKSINLILTPIT